MMDEEEELQLALELSKKTFELEENERKQRETNLICFETVQDQEQARKVNAVQDIVRSSHAYGWNRSLLPHSGFQPIFPPSPQFIHPGQYMQSPSAPLLPPRNSLPHSSTTPLLIVSSPPTIGLQTPPRPCFPQSNTLLSTPPRPSPAFAWKVQFSPLPAHRSINTPRARDPSTTLTQPSTPQRQQLYLPYSLLASPRRGGDGDLIDLTIIDDKNDDETVKFEQIRREFDPLYVPPRPTNMPLKATLERTASLSEDISEGATIKAVTLRRSESVESHSDRLAKKERKSPVNEANYLSIDAIRIVARQPDVKAQIDRLRSSVQIQQLPHFSTATVQYLPTPTSIKIVVMKDAQWASSNLTSMTLTVETTITASAILIDVLANFLDDAELKAHVPLDEYGLKPFGIDEFLPPEAELGKNVFVIECHLNDKDVVLEVGRRRSSEEAGSPGIKFDVLAKNKTHLSTVTILDLEDVKNVLETLKFEMKEFEKEAIERRTLSVAATSKRVKQCVKLLVKHLGQIEPVILHRHLHKYIMAGQHAMKQCSSHFIEAIHSFIEAYCNSTMSAYTVLPLKEQRKSIRNVYNVDDQVRVFIHSIHNLKPEWLEKYQQFYVSIHVQYGTEELDTHPHIVLKTIQTDAFYPYLDMSLFAKFKTQICECPREVKLMFLFNGVPFANSGNPEASDLLAVASLPLFDYKNVLLQGQFLVPLSHPRSSAVEPWGGQPLLCSQYDAVLMLTMARFSYDVIFPEVKEECRCIPKDMKTLPEETHEYLLDLLETTQPENLKADERHELWQNRHYLVNRQEALPLVLRSVPYWSYACIPEVYAMVDTWCQLTPEWAIQLLLPQYPDCRVRAKAVEWLSNASTDFLFNFLPQLVELLRFELYEDSKLAKFLLELAFQDRRFAYELYWQLQQRIDHCTSEDVKDVTAAIGCYIRRCQLLQRELLSKPGMQYLCEEIHNQHSLINALEDVQREVRDTEESFKLSVLRDRLGRLDAKLLEKNVRLPILPSFKTSGINTSKCFIFNSAAKPLKITFRGLRFNYSIIHKDGDDMRQDALVLQMVRLMNDIWLSKQLDLRIITFRCMPVGFKKGMIQLVENCETLRGIQETGTGVTGVFDDNCIVNWLTKHNPNEFANRMAIDNFQRSCAGWCVATYVLGIGDRHNDNILVTKRGHVFHIDFGKYMGDWQMAGGFKRDRVPFVFTREMFIAINGSQQPGEPYQRFIDMACQAFNYLRKQHTILLNLLQIMVCSDIPGINAESLSFVQKNLMLDLSDADATTQFTQLLNNSLNSSFTRFNFFAHSIAQKFTGRGQAVRPAEQNKYLTFQPAVFTKGSDGAISKLYVESVDKHMLPNKIYLYKIIVYREREAVPTVVYRSFEQFNELYLKLRLIFSNAIPVLSSSTAMRSNVRKVAVRRLSDVKTFLAVIMQREEVKDCDLIYSFFHTLYHDNKINDGEDELASDSVCKIHLNLAYENGQLKVFVKHVRNMAPLSTGQTPDAYVKTKILPIDDQTANSKRKTHVVKSTLNPTFNYEIIYPLRHVSNIQNFAEHHILEVSVWNSGGLMDNTKLYCTWIGLARIWAATPDRKGNRSIEEWFEFKNTRN